MNRILLFFCITIFSVILFKYPSKSEYHVRAIYSIPELNNIDIEKKIINEFSKINGINSCRASMDSKNVLLEYNQREISPDDLKKIFYKWGCSVSNVYYDNLFVYQ